MLVQDYYALDLPGARRLIAAHGRATIVSAGPDGLRATYAFCLLEDTGDDTQIQVVGHFAKADPQAADLLAGLPVMLMFDGPHGYVSASWYRPTEQLIPSTWNYSAVHLHGVAQVLTSDEAFPVLQRTLEHHEAAMGDDAFRLDGPRLDFALRLVPGTIAFRLLASRVEAKAKLSQDKPSDVGVSVVAHLEQPGPYHHPELAEDMRRIR